MSQKLTHQFLTQLSEQYFIRLIIVNKFVVVIGPHIGCTTSGPSGKPVIDDRQKS